MQEAPSIHGAQGGAYQRVHIRIRMLLQVGGNLAGVVMNNVDITSDHQYQYYTTYYSYYSTDGSSSGENAEASSMKKAERSGKAKELAATQSHDSEDLY